MKKVLILLIFLFLIIPNKVLAIGESADAYILMDMDSERILISKDMHERRLIASITKIMTAILAIESNRLDEVVTVDDSILKAYGSGIYIEIGEEITLRDLIYGLMMRSGNDAALMISTFLSGSEEEFVKKMNDKAKELGMTNTTFSNSSGLDNESSGNYSTCYDMALLTSYAMKNEEYRKIVGTKKYTVKTNKKTYIWYNKNKLLSLDYVTGGKTGFTEKARRTLVTTASLDNMNLVAVTLNDSDDWNTHKVLYEYAKENYQNYLVLKKDNFKVLEDLYYDNLYIKEDVRLTLRRSEVDKLINKIYLEKKDTYEDGEKLGRSDIYLEDKLLSSTDIYVSVEKNEEKKTSFFEKIWNWVKFW